MPAGGLARTSTRVGKAKKGAYRRRGGYMRKTTKKGAYNKNRKNQMMIRRAPMVETKTKTTEANTVMFGTHPRIGFEAYNTPMPILIQTFYIFGHKDLQNNKL